MAKIIFNNKNYNIDDSAIAPAMTALEAHLRAMAGGEPDVPVMKAAGLYQTGTDNMVASWDELLANGDIVVNDGAVNIGTKLPDNLPEKNEYGFYFGVPYTDISNGGFVFYEDGSFDEVHEDEIYNYPAGSVEYSNNSIYIADRNFLLTIIDDGNALDNDGYKFTVEETYSVVGDLVLPSDGSVTTIPAGTFAGSSNLTEVVVGSGTNVIDADAFYGCYSLTKVTIPDSVTYIGEQAFGGCENLQSITFDGTKDQWDAIDFGEGWHAGTGAYTLYCTDGSYEKPMCLSYSLNDDGQSYRVSGTGDYSNADTIVIPDTYNGLPVISIDGSAFSGCTSLTGVVVPDSVTSIGQGAFFGCSSLTEITLPFVGGSKKTSNDTYQYPFGYIFGTSSYQGGTATKQYYYGSSLSKSTSTTYYIPSSLKSVTVTGGNILYGAFYNCSSLQSVTIPDGVTSIGVIAFSNCSSLTSVTIPDGVTSIGVEAFYKCTRLQSVTIPDSVTSIDKSAFSFCNSLTSVVIPDSVTSIGDDAFSECSNLTSVEIPNGVTWIGMWAFSNCSSLTSVYITDIEAWCNISFGTDDANPLYYAKNLYLNNELVTELVIPDTITEIKWYAFNGCTSLTSVTIPDSVESIGDYAFSGCTGLTSIEIPNSVTSIGGSAFSECSSLTSIEIPNSVTSIGGSAFSGCSSLTSIEIPDSVTSIGNRAFRNCSSLTSVVIGDGVTSIGVEAFYKCTRLQSVTIPDSVTSIHNDTFYGCRSLTSVVIGNGVTSIGSAFRGCSSLTSVTIPDSVTIIGTSAFSGCSSLTSVVIGNGVTTIANSALEIGSETNLATITMLSTTPPTISSNTFTKRYLNKIIVPIGTGATYKAATNWATFADYIEEDTGGVLYQISADNTYAEVIGYEGTATEVKIVDTYNDLPVKSIASNAFYNKDKITSVIIPDSVTSIGFQAFYYCSKLTSVEIPDSVTSIDSSAFKGCSNLTDVYYTGTEEQWTSVSIASGNEPLTNATIHYNYVKEN